MLPKYIRFNSIFTILFLTIVGILYSTESAAQFCTSPSINLNVTPQDLRCNGDNSGSIVVNVTGANVNSTFTYDLYSVVQNQVHVITTASNHTFTNLQADDNYFIVVQVSFGGPSEYCSQQISIKEPDVISITPNLIKNASCNGKNDGSIDVTVTGGASGPYTYSWSNGATTEDISGLVAGTYTLTIKDGNGCINSASFTVTQPAVLASTPAVTNISCNGGTNGAINLGTISGGTAPYTYLWENGSTASSRTGLAAGSYSVTIKDANSCSKVIPFTITQPAVIAITQTVTNITCNGATTGAINITGVSGGTAPYTYLWDNASTGSSRTGLAAGSYSVTITDANSCSKTIPFTITQQSVITVTQTVTNNICNGGSTGSINITGVSGGVAPYTYLWDNGSAISSRTGLAAGSYSVTIKDASGCSKTFPFTITEPTTFTLTQTITNISCNGASTGAINISGISGGTGPYTYLWDNASTASNRTGLIAGTYSVTIKDANGCSKTFPFTITEPPAFTASQTVTNVSCNGGANGTINISGVSGGTAPYTYLWDNASTASARIGLAAGSYSVIIKDANGCSKTFPFTITQPTPIVVTQTVTNIVCNGTSTGAINITGVSGGTAPYSYLWDNNSTASSRTGLAVGNYSVTITDANSCSKLISFTIIQPAPITATQTVTNINCNGASTGAINITGVSGGTAPFTYLWENGSTASNRTALAAGNYSVTIKDAGGCSKTFPFTLTEPPAFTTTQTITNVSCNGSSTGAINITGVSGGTAPYTYLWDNASTASSRSGLAAGSYSVTIKDGNGCSKTFPFTITQPSAFTSTQTVTNITCNGASTGSINITSVSGGTAPYTYLWDNASTASSRTGLAAGSYSVTITDANGCSKTFPFTITQQSPIVITQTVTNITCNGATTGAINITGVSGGTAPYTYLWDNASTASSRSGLAAGSYSVTITDAINCSKIIPFTITEPAAFTSTQTVTNVTCNGGSNGAINITGVSGGTAPYAYLWDNGSTSSSRTALAAGNYSVTVKDAGGCSKTFPFTITAPIAISISGTITPETCNGLNNGSIAEVITGGTGTLLSKWSNGQTTASISNLAPGTYKLIVTDGNACKDSASYTLVSGVPITGTASATPSTVCSGNPVTIKANVDPTYTPAVNPYSFTNGSAYQSSNTFPIVSVKADTTVLVVLKDNKGCLSTPIPVAITTKKINATVTQTKAVSCNGDADGTLTVNVTGSSVGFNYSINGGSSFQASNIFTNLTAGSYTIIIDDGTVCKSSYIGIVTQPAKLTLTIKSFTNVAPCAGGNTGSIKLAVTGGNTGNIFTLMPGNITQTDSTFSGLIAGSYTISVTDSKACPATSVIQVITEPAGVDTTALVRSISNVTCAGGTNGSVQISNVTGGTTPYTYTLNGISNSTAIFSNLAPGGYSMLITDKNGCQKTIHFTISQPAPIVITGTPVPVTCKGLNDASITTGITGGTAPLSTKWSSGQTTASITNLNPGTYKLLVTDANGCKDSSSFIIINGTPITGTASSTPSTVCSGNPVTITADLDAAYSPATNAYSFTNGSVYQSSNTFPIASIKADTTVLVVLKDTKGCLTDPIPVLVATKKINATVTQTKSASCNGDTDGTLTVNVTGSSVGFNYSIDGGATYQPSNVFTNLAASAYTILIDDGTACIASSTGSITQPEVLSIKVAEVIAVTPCAGLTNGSIRVSANGGTPLYLFKLIPSGTAQKDSSFVGLAAGSYSINVTDSKGCSDTIKAIVIEPGTVDTAAIVPIIKNAKCTGDKGSVELTNITGGTAPYTYTLNGKPGPVIDAIAGNYTMIISDAKGCKYDYPFTISQPESIVFRTIVTPATCNDSDGSIKIYDVTGGTIPYIHYIIDGVNGTDTAFANLTAKTYQVGVEDSNNCIVLKGVTVKRKEGPVPYVRIKPPTCNGGNNGFLVIDSVSGGVPLFEYTFNNIAMGSSTVYSNLASGTYTVGITDQECAYIVDSFYVYNKTTLSYDTVSAATISIPVTPAITASILSVDADRYSYTGIAGIYDIKGGTPAYIWSSDNVTFNPVTSDTLLLNKLGKGVHTIYIQDKNGCNASFDIIIKIEFFIPNMISPNHDGKNDRFEVLALPRGSEFKVVNRWGNQVYRNMNYDNSWDGDELSDGTYYYELTLPGGDLHKGWVEIIR